MKKIFSVLSAAILTASLLAIPVSAEQASTQNQSDKEVGRSYCPTCIAVAFPYPKKDYPKKSDFIGTSIQHNGYTWYFHSIDDSLSTDTHGGQSGLDNIVYHPRELIIALSYFLTIRCGLVGNE